MFETISGQLTSIFDHLRRSGTLSEKNIREGMRQVRQALLEADVHFNVVRDFTRQVTEEAVGEKVIKSVSPGQQVVKIVHDRLVELMGPVDHRIPFASDGPTIIMLAGLQGSGKTTTCGKLAKWLTAKGKHPMLVAADVKRPAAVEQLKLVGEQVGVPVYAEAGVDPVKLCVRAVKEAADHARDVVILDTAGRLHIDEGMMAEVREIARQVRPQQVYLVCDAMTGQDAVNSAVRFNQDLELDGVILTKLDGDARGGAALSVKAVTGKPIKFVGTGEKLDRLEEFYPERMADRILGMGDVVTLVEKAQEAVDVEQAKKIQEKIRKNTLNLEDFMGQLKQIKRMGPLKDLLGMIPGLGKQMPIPDLDGDELTHIEAIIQSMTPEERQDPDLVDGSRRARIARGSGTDPVEVSGLLKQFRQMKQVMRRFGPQAGMNPDVMTGVMSGDRVGKMRSKRKRKERKKRRRH